MLFKSPVQLIPSDEDAIVYGPCPTATQFVPFPTTPSPTLKIVVLFGTTDQLTPSHEYAIVIESVPTETQFALLIIILYSNDIVLLNS